MQKNIGAWILKEKSLRVGRSHISSKIQGTALLTRQRVTSDGRSRHRTKGRELNQGSPKGIIWHPLTSRASALYESCWCAVRNGKPQWYQPWIKLRNRDYLQTGIIEDDLNFALDIRGNSEKPLQSLHPKHIVTTVSNYWCSDLQNTKKIESAAAKLPHSNDQVGIYIIIHIPVFCHILSDCI